MSTPLEICKGFREAPNKTDYIKRVAIKEKISPKEALHIVANFGLMNIGDPQYNEILKNIQSTKKSKSDNTVLDFSKAKMINDSKKAASTPKVKKYTLTVNDIANSRGLISLIKDQLDQGLSITDIANLIGVDDVNVIYRACKMAGLSVSDEKKSAKLKRQIRILKSEIIKIQRLNEYIDSYVKIGRIDYVDKTIKEQATLINQLLCTINNMDKI